MRAQADIVVPGVSSLDFFGALKSYDDAMSLPGPKLVKIATDEFRTISKELAALSDLSAKELKDLSAALPAKPWNDVAPIRARVDQALARLGESGRRIKISATRGRLLNDTAIDALLDSSEFLDRFDASRSLKERAELITLLKKQIERDPNRYITYLENHAVTLKRISKGLSVVKYVLLVAPIAPALYELHASWDNPNARGKALDQLVRIGTKTGAETALDVAVDIAVPAIALFLLPGAAGFFVVTSVFIGVGIAGGYLVDGVTNAIFRGEQIDADLSVLP